MRWYTTEEVCEILGRFEKIIVLGDSMMRHVVGAMNVILRKDLGYGAVTGWNFDDEERYFYPHPSPSPSKSNQICIPTTMTTLTHHFQ